LTRVVINQSNYIPWKGYFDLIHDADVFVFYDDVQFTVRDWRNRNKIKTPTGAQWLTIPVGSDRNRNICDVAIEDSRWQESHWKTIRQHYGRAEHFDRYESFFENIYLNRRWTSLSELNQFLTRAIAVDFLGIKGTRFVQSSEFGLETRGQERILDLVKRVGGDEYLSGPAGKAYLEEARFEREDIRLTWKSYDGYPEYRQFFPPFEHAVSILDVLFHAGPDSPRYIWGWRERPPG
jgi:hypothetical protein